MPRDILMEKQGILIKELREKLKGSGLERADLSEYVVESLAEQFNVSTKPIRIALQNWKFLPNG